MRLLLLSNSTNVGGTFLGHAGDWLRDHLSGARNVVFLPFAAARFSYDEFVRKVAERVAPLGCDVQGIHSTADPVAVVQGLEHGGRAPTAVDESCMTAWRHDDGGRGLAHVEERDPHRRGARRGPRWCPPTAAMSDPRIPRKHETGRLRAQVSPMLLSDLRQAPRSPTRRHAE